MQRPYWILSDYQSVCLTAKIFETNRPILMTVTAVGPPARAECPTMKTAGASA